MRTVADIARDIQSQDNRATSLPIFAVQQKRRQTGIDTMYTDDIVWVDSEGEASAEEHEKLEREYQENGDEPDGWTRTGYVDTWEFVTACFTEAGCNEYIAQNSHRLNEPRVYAYSGYRNDEWQAVRDFIVRVAT